MCEQALLISCQCNQLTALQVRRKVIG